jgi:GDPmannose 4,6-dehydratase
MTKNALITGISGQDGSYLAELLLKRGYQVHGLVRKMDLEDLRSRLWRLLPLIDKIHLYTGSTESHEQVADAVGKVNPDECYHLASNSFVNYSFEDAHAIIAADIRGTHNVLSALREKAPDCRFYFAASSEMFGKPESQPQNENSRFFPRSPYGIAKLAGYHLARNYREAYGLHASCGILYNHESPRRGLEFVTRKISSHVAKIKLGLTDSLALGNLDAVRDWGSAKEYVEAMALMVQQDTPGDYVVATGKTHAVRDFARLAFEVFDLNYEDYVKVDQRFFRPAEAIPLVGDARLTREKLGWHAQTELPQIVEEMVRADYDRLKQ